MEDLAQLQGLKRLRTRLGEIKTPAELVLAVPMGAVCMLCVVLLGLVCLLPPVMGLTFRDTAFFVAGAGESDFPLLWSSFAYSDHWFYWLTFVGEFLIFLGIFAALRRHLETKPLARSRRERARRGLLPLALLATLGWSCISWLLSGSLQRGFFGTGYRHDGVLAYLIYAGVFLSACLLATHSPRGAKIVAELLVGTGAFCALLTALNLSAVNELFHVAGDFRANVFNQYNHFGYYLAICVPMGAVLLVCDGAKKRPAGVWRVLLGVLRLGELWLLCNAVSVNSVRGSFVGIAAALVLLSLCFVLKKETRREILAVDGLFVLTLGVLNTGGTLLARFQLLHQQVADIQAAQGTQSSLVEADPGRLGSGRIRLWQQGLQFALERPVFGYGPDNLGVCYLLRGLNSTDRPHNEYIQIAASLGFPALAFYLTGLFGHFADFLRFFKRLSPFAIGTCCVAAGYLVSALFGNSMFYTTPYFFLCLGFSLGLMRRDTEANGRDALVPGR